MAIAGFRPNGLPILLIVALGMSFSICPADANDAVESPVNLAKKARLTARRRSGPKVLLLQTDDEEVTGSLGAGSAAEARARRTRP